MSTLISTGVTVVCSKFTKQKLVIDSVSEIATFAINTCLAGVFLKGKTIPFPRKHQ